MNKDHKYYKFLRGNSRKLMKAKAAAISCKATNHTFPPKGLIKCVLSDLRNSGKPSASAIVISHPE